MTLFHAQADTVLGILRSAGVFRTERSSLNGSLHKLVAAMIVQAYDTDTTIDVAVRRAGTFHHYGYQPKIVEYLDAAVEQGLLISQDRQSQGCTVPGRDPGSLSERRTALTGLTVTCHSRGG